MANTLDLTFEDDLIIDLDLWEVVNASDGQYSSDEESYTLSLSDDDVISLDDNDSIILPSLVIPPPPIVQDLKKRIVRRYSIGITYGDLTNRGGCYDEGEGEEEEEEDGGGDEYDDNDDLEDEIVRKKLGKGRVKKVVKKGIKKVPYSYLKNGCVRPGGKLGLGLKLRF